MAPGALPLKLYIRSPMIRFALLAVALAATACTSADSDSPHDASEPKSITNAIEASAIPEVADIPTEDAALEQAEAEVTQENADALYEQLPSEIEHTDCNEAK